MTTDELAAEIGELLNYPATDDPVEVLKSIAALIGDSRYTYFDDRGVWVYRQPGRDL
jgi:hypothetical protein